MFGVDFSAIGGKCDRRGLVAASAEKGVLLRVRHPQGYCGAWESLPHIGIESYEDWRPAASTTKPGHHFCDYRQAQTVFRIV